jgi:RNA polymerase sigma factor (sigma-70 family)
VLDPNVIDPTPAFPAAESAVESVFVSPGSESQDVAAMYETHRDLLLHVACVKFRVPETDAENLMQEVFVAYMQQDAKVENTKAWLVASMCNASRAYWRSQNRSEGLPDDFVERGDPLTVGLADQFAMKMTLRKALRYLQPRCRETLYLHYYEGRSAADVARELDTTNRYAEKLIHNCLKRVREIYLSITSVKR